MNAWQLQEKLSRRLVRWAGLSIAAGILMGFTGKPFWRGMGVQFASWGFIDGLIALLGQASSQKRLDEYENPGAPEVLKNEARKLRLILLVNVGLDVLYILGGRSWARHDTGDGSPKGHGWGIVLQGGFLLCFDLLHALMLRDDNPE
jgi:hypothetical protein